MGNNWGLILGVAVIALVVVNYLAYRSGPAPVLLPAAVGKRYINKETVDITWNADGLPVRIVTERDATQT